MKVMAPIFIFAKIFFVTILFFYRIISTAQTGSLIPVCFLKLQNNSVLRPNKRTFYRICNVDVTIRNVNDNYN